MYVHTCIYSAICIYVLKKPLKIQKWHILCYYNLIIIKIDHKNKEAKIVLFYFKNNFVQCNLDYYKLFLPKK